MVVAPWWRSASVYQVYIRSFADGDGDGIGDFLGLTEKLGYIRALGVDAIWLNPCFPSPQRDHGYDVSDYFDIEPDYGTLAEFDVFVTSAHHHGLKVLLDIVANHCSSDHRWFQQAVAAGPGSAERAHFWFRPGRGPDGAEPPNNWKAIFGGSAWTRVVEPNGKLGEWYLGVFTPFQPDWNFTNPDVIAHFEDMLTFWFDRGVDGFRADAVIYLGKVDGLPDADPGDVDSPLNPQYTYVSWQHDIWRQWRQLVERYEREHDRQLLLVAEAFSPNDPSVMLAYANPEQFHQAFAFDLMLAPWRAGSIRETIKSTLDATLSVGQLPAWTLNNHDTQRTPTRYGRADITELGGFHNGVFRISDASIDADLGIQRARAAAALVLALPGCVYLYAGEELGLPEVLDLPASARQDPVFHQSDGESLGRDGCRVPLPWTRSSAQSFGFSTSHVEAAPAWLPQPARWGALAAESQADDPASTLALFQRMGALRSSLGALSSADFQWVDGLHEDLVGFSRGDVLVVLNTAAANRPIPETVIGRRRVELSTTYGHVDPYTVPAHCTVWLR